MPGTIGNLLGAGMILDGQEFMLAGGSFYNSKGGTPLEPSKSIFSLSINSPKLNSNSQSEWEQISTTTQSNNTGVSLQGAPLTLLPRKSGWRTYTTAAQLATRHMDFLGRFINTVTPKPTLDSETVAPLFQYDFDKRTKLLTRNKVAAHSTFGYSLCQRPNGENYMLGGLGADGVASAELYLLGDQPKLLTNGPANGPASYFHSAECLKDHLILLGGFDQQQLREFNLLFIYDYTSGWKTEVTFGKIPSPRYLHATSTLPNGNVVVSGGLDGNNVALNDIYLLDTKSFTWYEHHLPLGTRFGHSLAVYINHLVIVQGWAKVPTNNRLSRRAFGDPKIVVIDTQHTPWVIVDSIIFNTPVISSPTEPIHSSSFNIILMGSITAGIFILFAIFSLFYLFRRPKPLEDNIKVRSNLNNLNYFSDRTYLETIRESNQINYSLRQKNEPFNHMYQNLNNQSVSSYRLPMTSTLLPGFTNQLNLPSNHLNHPFHPSEVVEERDLYDTGINLSDTNPPLSYIFSSTLRPKRNLTRSSNDSKFITVLSAGSNFSTHYQS